MNRNMDPAKGRELLARLDNIDRWPYPHYYLLILGIGFFFGFYDILTIGLALPKIQQAFSITLDKAAWTITSGLLGYIFGSFAISRIADIFGRKHGLILSISFFTIGSFICAISLNLEWLVIGRFITGIGIGAEIASVTTYLEELSPAQIRGRSTSIGIAFGMFGFAVVPFIAYILVPHFNYGWRILFLTGALAGVFTYLTRRYLPDSPRWLLLNQQLAELEKIVVAAELTAKQRGQIITPQQTVIDNSPLSSDTSLNNLLHPIIMKRILLFIAIWFIYYVGNYAWLTLAPTLFIQQGFNLSQSIGFVALSSFGFVLGSLISVAISEKFERKWSAIIIALIWSASLFLIGLIPHPLMIIMGGFISTTTIAIIIPILYIYTGENFPTRIRATCLAATDGLGHIGGAFCAQIIFLLSYLLTGHQHNYFIAFTIMTCTGILTAILLLFGSNMTKHSLSELSKY